MAVCRQNIIQTDGRVCGLDAFRHEHLSFRYLTHFDHIVPYQRLIYCSSCFCLIEYLLKISLFNSRGIEYGSVFSVFGLSLMVCCGDHIADVSLTTDISLENLLISDVFVIPVQHREGAHPKVRFSRHFKIKFCDFGLATLFDGKDFRCNKYVGKPGTTLNTKARKLHSNSKGHVCS